LIASLIARYGEERVTEAWDGIHGYPLSWATDPREVFAVAETLNTKGF
jgi:hypothetical protein